MSYLLHSIASLAARAAHLLDDDEVSAVSVHKVRGALREIRRQALIIAFPAAGQGRPSASQDPDQRAPDLASRADRTSEGPPAPPSPRHDLGAESRNRMDFVTRAGTWLAARAGANLPNNPQHADDVRDLSLLDVARECLTRSGIDVRGWDRQRIVGEAFIRRGAMGTSDFVTALADAAHKILMAAYTEAAITCFAWCKRGTVADFRAHNRYRVGGFGALDSLAENGEFKHKSLSDAERATIAAGTVGNIISVSRQLIINDDMGAFAAMPTALGRAAKRSVESSAYALLNTNSGLGPSQSDGQPLFHSNRANVGSGSALSVAAIDADRSVMARQVDATGEPLDIRPAVLVLATEYGGAARVINAAEYNTDSGATFQKPNAVRGLFREVVDTPRITGTRRYLFADPAVAPVFEIVFLAGNEEPIIEQRESWNTDGGELRVRFDFGVGAVDWRGAVTNSGTT